MADFHIRKGDRLPAIEARLSRDHGKPVGIQVADLTGASAVALLYRLKGAGALITKSAEFVGDLKFGKVKYAWATGDTDTVGVYDAYWLVTYASGETESFPNNSFFTISFTKD